MITLHSSQVLSRHGAETYGRLSGVFRSRVSACTSRRNFDQCWTAVQQGTGGRRVFAVRQAVTFVTGHQCSSRRHGERASSLLISCSVSGGCSARREPRSSPFPNIVLRMSTSMRCAAAASCCRRCSATGGRTALRASIACSMRSCSVPGAAGAAPASCACACTPASGSLLPVECFGLLIVRLRPCIWHSGCAAVPWG